MSKPVKDYIKNVLSDKRQEFGGKAVCPFAGPELESNKLMIGEVGEVGLSQLIDKFHASEYDSALFIIKDDIPADQTKQFQVFVNKLLKFKGLKQYKNICFNPNDAVSVDGYNPRSMSPYFMVNVARRDVLSKASKIMKKTNYYDKLPEEYLSFLNIKRRKKNAK